MVSLLLPVFGRGANRAFMHAVLGGVVCDVSGSTGITLTAENDRLPIIKDVFDYPIKLFSVQSLRMVT